MKVLFVSSGNSNEGIGILVKNQGESLKRAEVDLEYFTIKGKGYKGYLKNIFILRKFLRTNKFDIIHAHYSFSGFIAALAGAKPLIVSLMGTDTYSTVPFNYFIRFFYRFFWYQTIVKTKRMKKSLYLRNAIVLPNGVDINRFRPIERSKAMEVTGFHPDKQYIIFVADPSRPEKNFQLAKNAVEMIENENVILFPVFNILNENIPFFMSAADVLILTSLWEGGVNVVKEAMACNLPIVSVDVGDVNEIVDNIEGCFVCTKDPLDISNKLRTALAFNKRTIGRQRIIDLGLDSGSMACKMISIYKNIIDKR